MTVVSLHCGDWREAVASWPSPCALITDPPYGIAYASGQEGKFKGEAIAGDLDTSERDAAIAAMCWVVAAVFGHAWRVPHWGTPRHVLVWDKGEGVGMGDLGFPWRPNMEAIAIYGEGWAGHRGTSVLRAVVPSWTSTSAKSGRPTRKHPTEKPLKVLREIVCKTPCNLPIVDPFMGSGTTGVAALQCGRDFYGAELVPEHFAVAAERMTDVAPDGAQQSLLEGPT